MQAHEIVQRINDADSKFGHSDRRFYLEVDTIDEAQYAKDYYLREYHPQGYGTQVSISEMIDGKIRVTFYRYHCCD